MKITLRNILAAVTKLFRQKYGRYGSRYEATRYVYAKCAAERKKELGV